MLVFVRVAVNLIMRLILGDIIGSGREMRNKLNVHDDKIIYSSCYQMGNPFLMAYGLFCSDRRKDKIVDRKPPSLNGFPSRNTLPCVRHRIPITPLFFENALPPPNFISGILSCHIKEENIWRSGF